MVSSNNGSKGHDSSNAASATASSSIGASQQIIHHQPPPSMKKIHYPFWFGGSSSCFAAMVTHPLDLDAASYGPTRGIRHADELHSLQVRLQTRGPGDPTGMLRTMVHIVKNHGVLALYSGLSASLLRQLTYSTARFGVYEDLKSRLKSSDPSAPPPSTLSLVGIACVSGLVGGVVGNPADVVNVRMQRDAGMPHSQRRNYKHAFNGLWRMCREEGLRSLFRGVYPNSARAVLMTSSQLASYDAFKQVLLLRLGLPDNLSTHFLSSLAAGFVATTVCSPADVIKTKIMSAHPGEAGGGHGQGILTVIRHLFAQDGIRWMFRGWVPSFIRLGPHTIAMFLFLEQHRRIYRLIIGE
ncbi:Mitochondrial dicarboxylate transporter [Ascosphaera aggregata]|nr:Mitochondrial dicarboxylate transporter [Ascosphaera aggregata]